MLSANVSVPTDTSSPVADTMSVLAHSLALGSRCRFGTTDSVSDRHWRLTFFVERAAESARRAVDAERSLAQPFRSLVQLARRAEQFHRCLAENTRSPAHAIGRATAASRSPAEIVHRPDPFPRSPAQPFRRATRAARSLEVELRKRLAQARRFWLPRAVLQNIRTDNHHIRYELRRAIAIG